MQKKYINYKSSYLSNIQRPNYCDMTYDVNCARIFKSGHTHIKCPLFTVSLGLYVVFVAVYSVSV